MNEKSGHVSDFEEDSLNENSLHDLKKEKYTEVEDGIEKLVNSFDNFPDNGGKLNPDKEEIVFSPAANGAKNSGNLGGKDDANDWAKEEKDFDDEGKADLKDAPSTPYEFLYGEKDPYANEKTKPKGESTAEEKPKADEDTEMDEDSYSDDEPAGNEENAPARYFKYVDARAGDYDLPTVSNVDPIIGAREIEVMNGSGSTEFENLKKSFARYQEKPNSVSRTQALFFDAFEYLRRKDTDPTFPGGQERVSAAAAIMADAGIQSLETCKGLILRDALIERMKVECMRNRKFRDHLTSTRLPDLATSRIEGKLNINASKAIELYCFAVTVTGVCQNLEQDIIFPGKMNSEDLSKDRNYQNALKEIEKLNPIAADLKKDLESCHTSLEVMPKLKAMADNLKKIGPDEYLRLRKEKELYGKETFDAKTVNIQGFVPEKPLGPHFTLGSQDNTIVQGTGSPEFTAFASAYISYHRPEDVNKFIREKAIALFDASFEYLRRKDSTPTFSGGKERVSCAAKAMVSRGLDLLETCADPDERKSLVLRMKIECQRNKELRDHILYELPKIIQEARGGKRNVNYPAALELYSFALVVSGICSKTGKDALVEGKMDGNPIESNSRYLRAMQNISDFETTTKHIAAKLRNNLDDADTFRSLSEQFMTHIGGNGLKKAQPAQQIEEPQIGAPNIGN